MRERSLRRLLRNQQASQRTANSTTSSRGAAAAAAGALLLLPLIFSEVSAATAVPPGGSSTAAGVDLDTADEALGGGEGAGTPAAVRGGSEMMQLPRVPFCRAGADVANMWMPVWNPDSQLVETAKRVVVFGGRG